MTTQANNVANFSSEINSSGVTIPAGGGTGLSAPGAAGNVLTSDGSGNWTSAAPAGGGVTSISGGTAISVSASTGAVTVNNTGVTSLTAGTGISVNNSTGGITITNTAPTGGVGSYVSTAHDTASPQVFPSDLGIPGTWNNIGSAGTGGYLTVTGWQRIA